MLRNARLTNEPLRLLLDRLLKRDIQVKEPLPVTEAMIAETIKTGKPPPRGRKEWLAAASDEVVNRFATDLLDEIEPKRLLRLLQLFSKRRFPFDHQKLLQLAEFGDDRLERDVISIFAIYALSLIPHPDVRALALKMIAEGNRAERAVGLLVNNFEPGDWQLITELTRHPLDAEAYHSLAFGVHGIYKAHPSEAAAEAFTNFYEYGECSYCRDRNIEVLLELGALPEWMLEELKHDANSDLRARAQRGFDPLYDQAK